MRDVVIVSAARTPIGKFLGGLASLSAPQLAAHAITRALDAAQLDPDIPEQVILGHVLSAGCGQAPARQAARAAGLPDHTGATAVSKVCGSGLRAVMDAVNGIRSGEWNITLAGGMESMSNVPHLLRNSRHGQRLGHMEALDSMLHDGLTDAYSGRHMGQCAELCAKKYDFSRNAQDAYALTSYERARHAQDNGLFKAEIAPLEIMSKRGVTHTAAEDEEPLAAPLEKMPHLKPVFEADGTITAANASTINDGAAALVLAGSDMAEARGMRPIARVIAHASAAHAPEWFTTAPITASQKALERAELKASDIDVWEINEAFAVVAMASIHDLKLDPTKVNPRGGAIALGHPIGCSGARILTTLVHTLQQEQKRYGCASICIGGGEAAALIIENLNL